LGSTGWTPTTLNATAAPAEEAEAAEGELAAGDAAEHPDNAATMHRDAAGMTDSLPGVR
jgi:long-subunit fatty acid transport protein